MSSTASSMAPFPGDGDVAWVGVGVGAATLLGATRMFGCLFARRCGRAKLLPVPTRARAAETVSPQPSKFGFWGALGAENGRAEDTLLKRPK